MEIQNIQRKERRNIPLSLKITKKYSEFMKKENISPTALFNEAVKELMQKKAKSKVKAK